MHVSVLCVVVERYLIDVLQRPLSVEVLSRDDYRHGRTHIYDSPRRYGGADDIVGQVVVGFMWIEQDVT